MIGIDQAGSYDKTLVDQQNSSYFTGVRIQIADPRVFDDEPTIVPARTTADTRTTTYIDLVATRTFLHDAFFDLVANFVDER